MTAKDSELQQVALIFANHAHAFSFGHVPKPKFAWGEFSPREQRLALIAAKAILDEIASPTHTKETTE